MFSYGEYFRIYDSSHDDGDYIEDGVNILTLHSTSKLNLN